MRVSLVVFLASFLVYPLAFGLVVVFNVIPMLIAPALVPAIPMGTAHLSVPHPNENHIFWEGTMIALLSIAIAYFTGSGIIFTLILCCVLGVIAAVSIKIRLAKDIPPPKSSMPLWLAFGVQVAAAWAWLSWLIQMML